MMTCGWNRLARVVALVEDHPLTDTLAIGAGVFSDRSPDRATRNLLTGVGDFYGATLGLELSNIHRLLGERSERLNFSSTFALRYAFSNGNLNGVLVDPGQIGTLDVTSNQLLVHEFGLYVGSGLSF
jgi:hypothetical protein